MAPPLPSVAQPQQTAQKQLAGLLGGLGLALSLIGQSASNIGWVAATSMAMAMAGAYTTSVVSSHATTLIPM